MQKILGQACAQVLLFDRCVEILTRAKELSGTSAFVFPGRSADRPLSNRVFSMILQRMNMPVTAHGFRSSFRDWAAECTSFPRKVAEMALAHTAGNKVEATYRRADLFVKRGQLMMAQWVSFALTGPRSKTT